MGHDFLSHFHRVSFHCAFAVYFDYFPTISVAASVAYEMTSGANMTGDKSIMAIKTV